MADAPGFALSKNAGAFALWAPRDPAPGAHVGRPDRSLSTLRALSWLSLLVPGVDHFYLRSPITGVVKLLTFGGFFVWSIWDILQTHTETDKVLNYGLTAPFDTIAGIAQGMITDKPTNYAAEGSFGLWLFSAMFGFLGLDSFFALGRPAQGIRKIVDFAVFIAFATSMYSSWQSGSYVSAIILFAFALFFGILVAVPWYTTLSASLASPATLFDKGIPMPEKMKNLLNISKAWTSKLPSVLRQRVESDFEIGSIPGETLRKAYEIRRTDATNASMGGNGDNGDNEDSGWFMSLVLGSPLGIGAAIWALTPWGAAASLLGDNLPTGGVAGLVGEAKKAAAGGVAGLVGDAEKAVTALGSEESLKALAQRMGGSIDIETLKKKLQTPAALGLVPGVRPEESIEEMAKKLGLTPQKGGARDEPLSLESTVFGGTLIALIVGGAIKVLVDTIVPVA
jgi:hypothetical protein